MKLVGSDLFIGLQGSGSSSAGVQIFNTTTNSYTAGRLLAGLPSNNVNGFVTQISQSTGQETVYIATDNGVARWNASGDKWETAWTALDGLPISNVEDILEDSSGNLWMATPLGISHYDYNAKTFTNYDSSNGLMGSSTWGLAVSIVNQSGTAVENIFVSHDGRGTERPGISQLEYGPVSVIAQHQFDQLPSNYVTAVTSDTWGIHVATETGPLVHWVASNGQFNSGVNVFSMEDWPVYSMRSDGSYLIAVGENGATVVQSGLNGNSVVGRYSAFETNGAALFQIPT